MKKYTVGNYERISKATAKKLFLRGEKIGMLPCKAVPGSAWFPYPYILDREMQKNFVVDEIGMGNRFCDLVNSFEYYNCSNETGKYAAFYRETGKGF